MKFSDTIWPSMSEEMTFPVGLQARGAGPRDCDIQSGALACRRAYLLVLRANYSDSGIDTARFFNALWTAEDSGPGSISTLQ